MKKSIALPSVLILLWLLFSAPALRAAGQGERAAPVMAAPVVMEEISPVINLVGTAQAARVSRVAAEAAGKVRLIHFSPGDLVQAGRVLLELDKTNQELAWRAAQAALRGAEVRLEEARTNLERSASLKKARTISDQNYEKDLFQVRALEASLAAARADADRLEDTLARMDVRAPFTGYVIEKNTEIGQWLTPGAPAAVLADLSTVKVNGSLPERYVTRIKAGDKARVVFDALGDKVFEGLVTAIVPAADEASRNFPVEVTLENPEAEIKAGLLARVTLTGSPRPMLLAPKDALVLDRGRATVFVVQGDAVRPVEVQAGEAHDSLMEVEGELKAGDLVVTQGNERLRPGQKVMVVNPEPEEGKKGPPASP